MEPSELDNRDNNEDHMTDNRDQREELQNEQSTADSEMNQSEPPQQTSRNYESSSLDQALSSSRYEDRDNNDRKPFKSIKRQKASMIPRVIPSIPEPVKDIQQFLLKVADLVTISSEDSLNENVTMIAEAFSAHDDLTTYKEEVSEFIIKCFIQLTTQITAHATLISLLAKTHQEFVGFFLQKLENKILLAIEKDEVNNSKNLLAAYACFFSTGLVDSASFVLLLSTLLNYASSADAPAQLISTYLISFVIPYSIEKLSTSEEGYGFLVSLKTFIETTFSNYTSPFSTQGAQAIFTTSDEEMHTETSRLVFHPKSNGASDNFYELVSLVVELVSEVVSKRANNEAFIVQSFTLPLVWNSLPSLTSFDLKISEQFFANLNQLLQSNTLGSSVRNSLPVVGSSVLGESVSYGRHTSWLIPRFSILTSESYPLVSSVNGFLNNFDKYFLGLYIHDILVHFDPIINDDGTKLGNLSLLCNHLHSLTKIVQVTLPFSNHPLKLSQVEGADLTEEQKAELLASNEEKAKSVKSIETVIPLAITEHLFQHLLIVPQQNVHFSQICTVILTLCKKYSGSVETNASAPYSQYAAMTLMALLTNIVHLDIAEGLHNVLVEFFSFLFINSNNQWPHWDYWANIIGLNTKSKEEEEEAVGKSFYNQFLYLLLHKFSRLLNKDILLNILPSSYQSMLNTLYVDDAPNSLLNQFITGTSANTQSSTVRFYKHPDYLESFSFSNEDLIKNTANEIYEKLTQREDSNNILDYLEALPVLSKNYDNADILGPIFLHCLLIVAWSSDTLTSFTGMLENYNEVIKLTADSEDLQQKLVQTIISVCGPNDHLLQFVLNEMLRLNQISVTSLMTVFLKPVFNGSMETQFKFYSHIPSSISVIKKIILRSIDFVKASLAQKANQLVKENPEADSNQLIQSELQNILASINSIDLSSEDPKVLLDSTLKQNIKNSNIVYAELSKFFTAAIDSTVATGLNEEQLHQIKGTSLSLRNFLNRVYQGNQKYLAHKYGINIALI